MKDFDALRSEREQRERTFKIAGREFRFRPAVPAEKYSLYLHLADQQSKANWPEESFEIMNGTILELLEPESRDAWNEVISNHLDHPISLLDMDQIIQHCVAVQTGRPTTPLSPSGTQGGSGSTTSTDASASAAAPAPPA
jgi:hypothetical protein